MDICKRLGADQDVISGREMHHAQKGRSRYIAGQATNNSGFEVNHERIPEALVHESHALVVGRDIGALPKMSQDFDLLRKVI